MTTSADEISVAVAERKRHPLLIDLAIRLVREKPLGTIGGAIVLILLLVAVFADALAPYGVTEMTLDARLSPPSATHLLGTDNVGRDLLSRIIYGSRLSLYVGVFSTILAIVISTIVGIVSGYAGGKTDLTIQRLIDGLLCFPPLVIVLTVIAVIGPGLWQVILVIGFTQGYRWVRVVRSAVVGIKENMYFEAARAIGVPVSRILSKHVLPNVMAVIIVIFSVNMGQAILLEATMSFLGFGIPPPAPSWGGMLSGAGRQFMLQAPWMMLWPGVALALVVYGINMLGDAIRDLLDPRLRGGLGRYAGVKRKIPK